MLPLPLTHFEIQKYYQSEPKFIKDNAYGINLDCLRLIGTNWMTLYVNGHNITYLDSFENENIPEELIKSIDNKNTTTNIYRTQAIDSKICW